MIIFSSATLNLATSPALTMDGVAANNLVMSCSFTALDTGGPHLYTMDWYSGETLLHTENFNTTLNESVAKTQLFPPEVEPLDGVRKAINRKIAQIPQCTCPMSHNTPFRTEMCIRVILFRMVYCEIWNRYTAVFVKLVFSLVGARLWYF